MKITLPAWVKSVDDDDPTLIAGYGEEHADDGISAQLYSYFEEGEDAEAPDVQIVWRGHPLQESLSAPTPVELRTLSDMLRMVAEELER